MGEHGPDERTSATCIPATRAAPGIIERPRQIEDRVLETPLPVELGQILGLTLAPIDGWQSAWAFARRDGTICRFDADTGYAQELCRVDLPLSDPGYERSENGKWRGPRLHVSAAGTFAAIVHDYGNHADVYDLRSGTRTITLRKTTDHAGRCLSRSRSWSVTGGPLSSSEQTGTGLTSPTRRLAVEITTKTLRRWCS